LYIVICVAFLRRFILKLDQKVNSDQTLCCQRRPVTADALGRAASTHERCEAAAYRNRHRKNASTMITAAAMATIPSALMVAPQRSMINLSDMHGSPLKTYGSLRGTIYLSCQPESASSDRIPR
jgi:hypothetical protein